MKHTKQVGLVEREHRKQMVARQTQPQQQPARAPLFDVRVVVEINEEALQQLLQRKRRAA